LTDTPDLLDVEVPYSDRGAPVARRWLRRQLEGRIPTDVLDDLLLCASELVTNSYQHARPGGDDDKILIFLQFSPHCVRVDVFDNGSSFVPVIRKVGPDEIHGRGLWVVDQLSFRWGSYGSRTGGAVWFEFHTSVQPLPDTETSDEPKYVSSDLA
jgi:anti-sigma regulatory factor (Ser/Thr protein kinase)